MNKILKVYNKKFQKSKVFLYPLLGLSNKKGIKPSNTYMSFDGFSEFIDTKLTCVFSDRNNSEFIDFENKIIFNNKYFEELIELENGDGAYVFSMSEFTNDFYFVTKSKYSRINSESKERIIKSYNNAPKNKELVKSYLVPKLYHDTYAGILSSSSKDKRDLKEIMKEVVELCPKILFDDETLISKAKSFDLIKL